MSAPAGTTRPTRTVHPHSRPDTRELAPPPVQPDDSGGAPLQMLLPVVGALTSVTMMVVLRNGQPLFMLVAAIVFLVAIAGGIIFAVSSRGRGIRQMRRQRELYLDYLERVRGELRSESDEALLHARLLHPAPSGLLDHTRDPARRWERRREDSDHLSARIGTADLPWFTLHVPSAESPIEPQDPVLLEEAGLLRSTMTSIPGMPAVAELHEASVVAVIGDRSRTVPLVRSLLAQLASHQLPEDLRIAAAFGRDRALDWQGIDLLPHVQSSSLFDGPVPARRIAPDVSALSQVLGPELVDRVHSAAIARRGGAHGTAGSVSSLLVVADQHGGPAESIRLPESSLTPGQLGIVHVHLLDDRLDEPDDVDIRIDLRDEPTLTHEARSGTARTVTFEPDETPVWQFTAIARDLAAHRTLGAAMATDVESATEITDLLGIDPSLPAPLESLWKPRIPSEFLRVPFAVDDHGSPMHLDLKEAAQQGMGPHGICIGATGSGKSELLRTLVLSLALGHSPEDLSMILVDYKGGAAFAPFSGLPHIAGLIDNLADDPQLTVRARSSLQGEVVRRQQLLKDADSSPSITHYRELRRTNPDLPPMPHLLVVIDEFGELLTAEREFIDLFLQIGRIGRSIGVHLLLSSQRIEGGQLRGLDTYLSYRLGLRTFSEAESQIVLDTADAFSLPSLPGYGYLKVDTSIYQRFRAGYVSGPMPTAVQRTPVEDARRVFLLPTYNGIATGEDAPEAPVLHRPDVGRSLVDEMVDHLRSGPGGLPPVWLPPLESRLALGHVLEGADSGASGLSVTIGLQDDPMRQSQAPWVVDLTRAGGHLIITGAPQTGRSTLLRTIGASLALTCTPQQVAIYGMDLTGSGLRRLEQFPHVGGVATRGDETRITRLVEELAGMIAQRERLFKEHRIESVAHLRQLHSSGRLPQLQSADVVVLLDGYGALRTDLESLEPAFLDLMGRASSFGIHLVVTLSRWGEMRMAHQSLFGTRIELRLNDPTESVIDRKLAETIPDDVPGRALSDAGLLGQIAQPTLEIVEHSEVGDALEELARTSAQSWGGPSAAPIRLLPPVLASSEMPDVVDEPRAVPLGLRQDTMDPAFWDFTDGDQHLLVLGDAKCGKTSALRTIAEALIARYTPEELAIAVIDPRGQVPEVIPEEYLAAHATASRQASGLASSIAVEMERRPTRTAEENKKAPMVVLLVDDHDIVSAGGEEPLAPLMPHLPSARDLGLHIVLTRPVSGASRAMYYPVVLALRETGGATLLMSGDRAEGPVLPRIYPERMPPGRGRYVRRGERPYVMQVALTAADLAKRERS